MKVFIVTAIFLSFLTFTSVTSLNLDCEFTDGPFYSIIGNPHQCKVQNTTSIINEYQIVNSINGRQSDVNSHSEVQMLWVTGTIFHFIPLGVGGFFVNLEAIWIRYGGLKKLEFEKMKQFPNLRYLYLRYNKLEVLKPDVFKGNSKLEWIDLKGNRLRFIDGEIFTVFKKLQNLNLKKNYCIDQQQYVHHGKFISLDHLLHLKHDIDMNCHRPNELYCSLYNMSHQGIDYYTCSSKGTAINRKNVQLTRILHNKIPSEFTDVLGFSIHNQNFTNFPQNLHEFLPDLMAIQIISCGLNELNSDDLKHFTNLKSLWLPLNHIEVLKNGVFDQNIKLEKLSLYGNRLRIIESHVLMPLQFLKFASFEKNVCIDIVATEGGEFEDLKRGIAGFCTGY